MTPGLTGFLQSHCLKVRPKERCYPETQLTSLIQDTDFVLCAPQVRAQEEKFKEICSNHNVPYAFVDPMDFAMMQGEKVLDFVLKTYGESKEKK